MNHNIETHTGYMIYKDMFTKETYFNLKSKMSSVDFNELEKPVAFFILGDYVVIPKIPKKTLNSILKREIVFEYMLNDNGIETEYELNIDPLEHQIDLLDDVQEVYDRSKVDKKAAITLQPGFGKTYCFANMVYRNKARFLFIVNASKIAEQALQSCKEFIGNKKSKFILVKDSEMLDDLKPDDVHGLFMTHAMLRASIKKYGLEYILVMFNTLGINFIAYDEFDMETGSFYRMLAFFNFKYSLCLTGTPMRSLPMDNRVFQLILKDIPILGGDIKINPKKDIDIIHFSFKPTRGENYLITSKFKNAFLLNYNNTLANKDVLLDFIMLKYYKGDNSVFKNIIKEDGSIVIFAGRVEQCENIKEKLISYYKIDENDIGIINNTIKEKDKLVNIKKPFIISLTKSLGRGIDAKNLRCLIFLSFEFNVPSFLQAISRVGRVGSEKIGLVIYPVCETYRETSVNFHSKEKKGLFLNNFRNITKTTIPESFYEKYYYGYRPNSKIAIELQKKESAKKAKMAKKIKNYIY